MGVYNMPPFLGVVRNVNANPDENVDGDLLQWNSTDREWKRVQASTLPDVAPDSASFVTVSSEAGLSAERVLTATASETTITDNITTVVIGIADNPVLPGTVDTIVPVGTSAQETGVTDGGVRYDNDTDRLRTRQEGTWYDVLFAFLEPLLKTADYTVQLTDYVLLGDASSGPMTFSLPPPDQARGKHFFVKRINGGVNDVTINVAPTL